MSYGTCTPDDLAPFHRGGRSSFLTQPLLCGAALALTSAIGLWLLYGRAAETPIAADPVSTPVQVAATPAHTATADERVALPAAIAPLRRYAGLLDPAITSGLPLTTFAQSAPLRAGFQPLRRRVPTEAPDLHIAAPRTPVTLRIAELRPTTTPSAVPSDTTTPAVPAVSNPEVASLVQPDVDVADVPLPPSRPAFVPDAEAPRGPVPRRVAALPAPAAPPAPAAAPAAPGQAAGGGFFEKMFSIPRPAGQVLAYAAPEDSGIATAIPGRATGTAIYEIATHTVHMPDGSRLEAHSGLGAYLDNPAGITVRMRGPTPPNTYELTLRESLFHGVQALRLTPIGGTTYGRGGLLAHTFMLGPRGDSNGCVVFRNYRAFLAAYMSGQVRRLVVVERL